jgi:hypothetical protein
MGSATTALNRVVRSEEAGSLFPDATPVITTAISFNQGDLLCLEPISGTLIPLNSALNSQSFVGIATVTVVTGNLKSPYSTAVDAAQGQSKMPGPIFACVASMKLKTGDSFVAGNVVYHDITSDAQTVTAVQPVSGSVSGSAIGLFQGPNMTSVASGQQGLVKLGHTYPNNTLVIP